MDLSRYSSKDYNPGNIFLRICWYSVDWLFFNSFPFPSKLKVLLLRLFGTRIGKNVIIKPNVKIKYPWFLKIKNNVWLGERIWIDNLCKVSIGNNVCISQGAMLLTGNHDYKKETFNLITGKIVLENSVWIGAKAIVCPNVRCKEKSVLTAGSIATKDMKKNMIYQGNPAKKIRNRTSQE